MSFNYGLVVPFLFLNQILRVFFKTKKTEASDAELDIGDKRIEWRKKLMYTYT